MVGQARISASYAALRTRMSGLLAMPRTAAIGNSFAPSGNSTRVLSCDVTSPCSRPHADEPVVESSA